MPVMTFGSGQRAQLAKRLRRSLEDTRTHARRAATARRTTREIEGQKKVLVEKNPSLANLDSQQKTTYLVMLVCIAAVYVLDVVLFNAVSEYIIGATVAGLPWLTQIARVMIP